MSVNREVCAKKNYRKTTVPPYKYYLQIKIPKYFRSNITHIIHEELELKYLNQTAIVRICYDTNRIILEIVLNLPFYKYAERYSVAKQSASYIIYELRKKFLGLGHINTFLDEEYELGNTHRKVLMTLNSNDIDSMFLDDVKVRIGRLFLFGNLKIHNLHLELILSSTIIQGFKDSQTFYGVCYTFGGIDWHRINGSIVIGIDTSNITILKVIMSGINGDISTGVISCDPHEKFRGILNELYRALGICSVDVINVNFKSGHFTRMVDKERSNLACTDINELNQRNDNKRSLMFLGLVGFRDFYDYSNIKKCNRDKISNYEIHFDNYDNRSIETILSNIDYLFCTGDRERENVSKIFPNYKVLAEKYNAIEPINIDLASPESLESDYMPPFEITAVDNNFKNNFSIAIRIAHTDCILCNLGYNSESNPPENREIYYKFWLEKIEKTVFFDAIDIF